MALIKVTKRNFMATPTRALRGLQAIAADYDLYLFDQWGVIHDGHTLYPHVEETIRALRALPNKMLVVLSNSSRRAHFSRDLMCRMGLEEALWDDVITSGEHCIQCLKERPAGFYADLGRRYYCIHWPEGYSLPEDLDYEVVTDLAQADFLLLTGMNQSLDAYTPLLNEAKQYGLPMVCANPDLRAPEGRVIKDCPGLIAEKYRQISGVVSSHGKPATELYDLILRKYAVPRQRVLAVGDSLDHDIQGANNVDIASMLLTQGIHRHAWHAIRAKGHDVVETSAILCTQYNVHFDYVSTGLQW
ncbi:MAG: TIGR01459 family HAD-type hydrolase [Alphaproteobacteria bacterium]|nr:TIGR01459 family HAD-type hydrolase [Alphaproteobacteria bacterium]